MATRVSITKALEAKLRADKSELVQEVVKLLDDEQGKREAGSKDQDGKKTGLGYKELVSLLRSHLGDSLLTPPKPNTAFIIKIVNKAKEQGLDSNNVGQIIEGLRRVSGRGPHRIGDIVYNIDRYYNAGAIRENSGDADNPNASASDAIEISERVYSGRSNPTFDE